MPVEPKPPELQPYQFNWAEFVLALLLGGLMIVGLLGVLVPIALALGAIYVIVRFVRFCLERLGAPRQKPQTGTSNWDNYLPR